MGGGVSGGGAEGGGVFGFVAGGGGAGVLGGVWGFGDGGGWEVRGGLVRRGHGGFDVKVEVLKSPVGWVRN